MQLQTNGVDAIFWTFLKPFLNVSISSNPSSSSSNTSSNAQELPSVNSSNLNNSNVLVASNSNVSQNYSQQFGGGEESPETTTTA